MADDAYNGNGPISDLFREYLGILKKGARAHSETVELDAYEKMGAQIENEEDPEIKKFMRDTLAHYCNDDSMLLSYVYKNYWNQWVSERRSLQDEIQPIGLYIALESILANQCDSSGYTKTYGQRRYPLTIPGNYSGSKSVRNIDADVPSLELFNSYYKFGVHRFQVGYAIKGILDHLQERYGLDFGELERNHQLNKKSGADRG